MAHGPDRSTETGDRPVPSPPSVAFDYVDPGSYGVHLVLSGRIAAEPPIGTDIRWRPLELRVPGSEALDAREFAWDEMTRCILTALRAHGVDAKAPGIVPLTRKAHELACHAREHGRFGAIHGALFTAHFESGLDIGRVDVLVGLAAEAGLDAAEARTVLGVDRFGDRVEDERRDLLAEGVTGVPTIWSDHGRIEGFRSPDVLIRELRIFQ